jgi:hypothetical protein
MKTLLSISVGLCAMLVLSHSYAQFVDMSPVPVTTSTIGLKYSNSSYHDDTWFDEGPSGGSGVFKLYGMFPMKNGWSFNAELPFVIAKLGSVEDSGLANIYLGFQKTMKRNERANLSFGVYLPTIGEAYDRAVVGFTSDIYGSMQYIKAVTARLNLAYNAIRNEGIIYGFDAGPDVMIPAFEGANVELFLHFSAKGGYAFGGFAAWAELNNLISVTAGGYITDEILSNLVIGGQLMKSRVRPGVFYGIPLDGNTREVVKGTLQVKMEFLLGR